MPQGHFLFASAERFHGSGRYHIESDMENAWLDNPFGARHSRASAARTRSRRCSARLREVTVRPTAGGRAQRRPPGGVQARLEPPRTRRTVPAQRRTPEPAAQGRHRLPRLGHHRQPRREGGAARHPRRTRYTRRLSTRRDNGPCRCAGTARSSRSIAAAAPLRRLRRRRFP